MTEYIVELESNVWLAPWSGDPGRTLAKGNAKVFATYNRARRALAAAREYRPFASAMISEVETELEVEDDE